VACKSSLKSKYVYSSSEPREFLQVLEMRMCMYKNCQSWYLIVYNWNRNACPNKQLYFEKKKAVYLGRHFCFNCIQWDINFGNFCTYTFSFQGLVKIPLALNWNKRILIWGNFYTPPNKVSFYGSQSKQSITTAKASETITREQRGASSGSNFCLL
jgi:hypothetical protein